MIPVDKQRHLAGGAIIAFTLALFFGPLVGLLAAIAAGAAKELYDGRHPESHTQDAWDFVATAAGGAYVYLVHLL